MDAGRVSPPRLPAVEPPQQTVRWGGVEYTVPSDMLARHCFPHLVGTGWRPGFVDQQHYATVLSWMQAMDAEQPWTWPLDVTLSLLPPLSLVAGQMGCVVFQARCYLEYCQRVQRAAREQRWSDILLAARVGWNPGEFNWNVVAVFTLWRHLGNEMFSKDFVFKLHRPGFVHWNTVWLVILEVLQDMPRPSRFTCANAEELRSLYDRLRDMLCATVDDLLPRITQVPGTLAEEAAQELSVVRQQMQGECQTLYEGDLRLFALDTPPAVDPFAAPSAPEQQAPPTPALSPEAPSSHQLLFCEWSLVPKPTTGAPLALPLRNPSERPSSAAADSPSAPAPETAAPESTTTLTTAAPVATTPTAPTNEDFACWPVGLRLHSIAPTPRYADRYSHEEIRWTDLRCAETRSVWPTLERKLEAELEAETPAMRQHGLDLMGPLPDEIVEHIVLYAPSLWWILGVGLGGVSVANWWHLPGREGVGWSES